MNRYKPLILIFMLIAALSIHAQENERAFSMDVSADLVSRYIWRGMSFSSSPAIQPCLDLQYKNFTLGSWASYTFSPEPFQEVDLYVTYTSRYFEINLTDYYNPLDTAGAEGDFFDFTGNSTRHTLEGTIAFSGPEAFPVSLLAGVMIYGNDRDDAGNNLYSTYLELSYVANIQDIELTSFIGFTPFEGYYAEKPAVVNAGITAVKNITVTDRFMIPLTGSLIVNPSQDKIFFIVGITL